jgi:S1-C subfamily serine protease
LRRRKMRLRWIAVAIVTTGVISGLVGAGAAQVLDGGGGDGSAVSAPAPTTSAAEDEPRPQTASQSEECLSAADIYEQVRPSVVEITSTLGGNGPFAPQGSGTGTGIIIDSNGYILTNYHVVQDADSIEVRFNDGSTAEATLTGSDPANDLAVIKMDATGRELTVADLGDSDSLRVGDAVLALGNPFNLEGTLTQGIVSALDRTYSSGATTRPIRGMIQTDAPINPGNSGGPLLNCFGEVIGVNTLLENPTGENVNVGVAFSVAINTAKASLDDMTAGEAVSHAWLGIAGMDVTPALAEELGLGTDSGVYVTLISNGSPAAATGLEGAFASQNQAAAGDDVPPGGDVITAVDGRPVSGIEELAAYLDREKQPGDSVELTVVRAGDQLTLTAELANWPA